MLKVSQPRSKLTIVTTSTHRLAWVGVNEASVVDAFLELCSVMSVQTRVKHGWRVRS